MELVTTKKPAETMSDIDNSVLSQLLLQHFCGFGQTLVYAHYNVSNPPRPPLLQNLPNLCSL